jgi:hypothetical protein
MPGKPALRPQDPDVTGGYYQPVRAKLAAQDGTHDAFALERLKCNLANAPPDLTAMFNAMIKPNQNPVIASVTLDPAGAATPLFMSGQTTPPAPTMVAPGAAVTLEAAWTAETPETYPVFNALTQAIDTHREALSVSWYATDGSFAHDRTGRSEMETDLTTDNTWTAPTMPTCDAPPCIVHFFVVLRDIRGGVDFAEAALQVGS